MWFVARRHEGSDSAGCWILAAISSIQRWHLFLMVPLLAAKSRDLFKKTKVPHIYFATVCVIYFARIQNFKNVGCLVLGFSASFPRYFKSRVWKKCVSYTITHERISQATLTDVMSDVKLGLHGLQLLVIHVQQRKVSRNVWSSGCSCRSCRNFEYGKTT